MAHPPGLVLRHTFLESEPTTNTESNGSPDLPRPRRSRAMSDAGLEWNTATQAVSLYGTESMSECCQTCQGTGKGLSGCGCYDCNGTGQKQDHVDDKVGLYRIVHNGRTIVTPDASLQNYTELAVLSMGAVVNVVELASMRRDKRIRARIEEPPGWISLTNTENGYCWAVQCKGEVPEETVAARRSSESPPGFEEQAAYEEPFQRPHPEVSRSLFELAAGVHNVDHTTVLLQQLPRDFNRDLLMDCLNSLGFAGSYNFVYLPLDLTTQANLGYALVNFITPGHARQGLRCFNFFSTRNTEGSETWTAGWSEHYEGLQALVERYQNSPVMHERVPNICKPLILQAGVPVPFPQPTRRVRMPRLRRKAPDENVSDDSQQTPADATPVTAKASETKLGQQHGMTLSTVKEANPYPCGDVWYVDVNLLTSQFGYLAKPQRLAQWPG